uniref:Uncharacterized protein n=1 Tax=Anopheles albimanus TaxID=7167 RepID=A0A182FY87_ANOAL
MASKPQCSKQPDEQRHSQADTPMDTDTGNEQAGAAGRDTYINEPTLQLM